MQELGLQFEAAKKWLRIKSLLTKWLKLIFNDTNCKKLLAIKITNNNSLTIGLQQNFH
jgi:hypothetical protein